MMGDDTSPLFPSIRPTSPFRPSFARLTAFTAAISGLCFGYEIGICDAVLAMPSFQHFFQTDASVDGWIVSSFLLGCLLGTLAVSFSADRFGRKPCLVLGACLFIVGGCAQTAAAGVPSLCLGRTISGVGIGCLSMVAPLYICEVATPQDRGKLVALQQLLITVGIFAASCANAALFVLGAGLGEWQWRSALAAQVAPGALLLLLALPLPRSPRWLVMVGREGEAKAVLARLREAPVGSQAVEDELRGIRAELGDEGWGAEGSGEGARLAAAASSSAAAEDAASLSPLPPKLFTVSAFLGRVGRLFAPNVRARTLLVVGLQVCQQWTGINVILYFAARLFERAGADKVHAATSLVVGNAVLLVGGTLLSMKLIDAPGVGRRMLLLYGAVAMAASHGLVALLVGLADNAEEGSTASTALSTLAVASMFAFTLSFSATWGPVVWVVQNELLPLDVRAQGCALGTAANWASNAVM